MSRPSTMPALVLREDGYSGTSEGPSIQSLAPYLDAVEIAVPRPRAGQVLVEVGLAGINPSDLHFIKGEYGLPRRKGVPAGFEGVGTVVEAGEGGEALVGRRVGFVAGASGAWARYALADVASCVPVLDAVRDEDAAALFVNPLTAIAMFGIVREHGGGAFVMTAAASQLCKLMTGLARDEGVTAISVVRRASQAEALTALGASVVLDAGSEDFQARLAATLKEHKPRVLLDAVADPVSSQIFAAMPARARWVIYGRLGRGDATLTEPGQMIFMDKKVEGFWLTQWLKQAPREVVAAAGRSVQERFASGAWSTDVAAIIPLADAFDALPKALAGANVGKVFLKP